MPIYSLDFSDDEDNQLCECSLCYIRDYPIFQPKTIAVDLDLTDTEDEMSVDLEDDESDDEQDLIDGEEEYQKFKHTLSDFIEDDLIEDISEEYLPPRKRNKLNQ
jgi:hypothetical protein